MAIMLLSNSNICIIISTLWSTLYKLYPNVSIHQPYDRPKFKSFAILLQHMLWDQSIQVMVTNINISKKKKKEKKKGQWLMFGNNGGIEELVFDTNGSIEEHVFDVMSKVTFLFYVSCPHTLPHLATFLPVFDKCSSPQVVCVFICSSICSLSSSFFLFFFLERQRQTPFASKTSFHNLEVVNG